MVLDNPQNDLENNLKRPIQNTVTTYAKSNSPIKNLTNSIITPNNPTLGNNNSTENFKNKKVVLDLRAPLYTPYPYGTNEGDNTHTPPPITYTIPPNIHTNKGTTNKIKHLEKNEGPFLQMATANIHVDQKQTNSPTINSNTLSQSCNMKTDLTIIASYSVYS